MTSEMFGPGGIEAIANILGTELPGKGGEEEEDEEKKNIWETLDEKKGQKKVKQVAEEEKNTRMVIRKGTEGDVFRDCRKENLDGRTVESCINRVGDYTEEEFRREFIEERTEDEIFEMDSRKVACVDECSGGTFLAGRQPDKNHLVMTIKLPGEDKRTIDLEVNAEKIILFSHQYRARAYWSKRVVASAAQAEWDPDKGELRVLAPVQGESSVLRF